MINSHNVLKMYFSQGVFDSKLVHFCANNLYKYERGKSAPIVKGRLRARVKFWENICAPYWVTNTITNGYVIPFNSLLASAQFRNNHSVMDNNVFVSQVIFNNVFVSQVILLSFPATDGN